jgi:hypothetical protein
MAKDAPGMRGYRSRNEDGELRQKRGDTHISTGLKFADAPAPNTITSGDWDLPFIWYQCEGEVVGP